MLITLIQHRENNKAFKPFSMRTEYRTHVTRKNFNLIVKRDIIPEEKIKEEGMLEINGRTGTKLLYER